MNKQLTPEQIRALPVAERLRLIEELWDSLDADADEVPLAAWQEAEIDTRLDALDAGRSVGSPWEEVRRRIQGET